MSTRDLEAQGGVLPIGARVELTARRLGARCAELAIKLTADGRVAERDAARLLEVHNDTLARKRQEGAGPPAYAIGVGRGRISYSLIDLASWIESRREKIDIEAA